MSETPAVIGRYEVERQLGLYDIDPAPHREALTTAIDRVLRTPLSEDGAPLRLADISRADRIDERVARIETRLDLVEA